MHASDKLAGNLQKVLVDLIDLHVQGKQAHWNVLGHNFRDLHLQLDEIVTEAREFSDTVAERMRALFATPDGRSRTVGATSSLDEFPEGEVSTHETVEMITARLYQAVGTMRDVHDEVDEEDPATADSVCFGSRFSALTIQASCSRRSMIACRMSAVAGSSSSTSSWTSRIVPTAW
jgi:starvation-inducible DNA-binding protein